MAGIEDIRAERIGKLDKLKKARINPYPGDASCEYTISEIQKKFDSLFSKGKSLTLSGRLMAIREHGGSIFGDLYDGSGSIQIYLKKDGVSEESFSLFIETTDIGDFCECTGELFLTKKGERSLKVSKWRMLAKSLRPLPDKWHGLTDPEERFRKRYLDIVMSHEVRERFEIRSKIITCVREFLNEKSFLEVETPMLQPVPGGATAKPFKTHHNALDINLYLRVAPELYLKELLIAGFTKIFELGRSFRNEGIDITHNPEFTIIEAYSAYSSPKEEMKLIEDLFSFVVKKVIGKDSVEYSEVSIDFSKAFRRVTFTEVMKKFALISSHDFSNKEELAKKAAQYNIRVENFDGPEKILDNIYKKVVRPKLIEPTFVFDYPVQFSPLAKKKEGSDDFIDRFQLIVGGIELVNGFSELNDPLEQRERFAEQEKKRKEGDDEAQIKDDDYIEAMEYGMPPACGWGIGIDRLVMLLTNTKNIREVIIFPTLRPK